MQDIRQTIIERVAKDIPLIEIYAGLDEFVDKTEFYKIVAELIETGAIPNTMICWCGIDCMRCRTFRATLNNDDEMRKTIKIYYEEIGSNIEIRDLYCLGCHSDEIMPACFGCPYMKCGKEKGLKRCNECNEYPCESLQWYTEKYIKPSIGKLVEPVALKIRNINKEEYKGLYSHMKRDFPPNELPPLFAVKRNFKKGIYDGFYLTEETDIGYAVITAPENMRYGLINYFAILPEHRSKGYGSEFLKIILNHYSDHTLVLEADDPAAAKTDVLRDEAVRRVRFYERAGFRVIPTKKAKIFGVDMLIMASGQNEKLSAREIMRALYLPAFGTKQFLRFIDVIDF